MGIFDKAKDLPDQHGDPADSADQTGLTHSDQVDPAAQHRRSSARSGGDRAAGRKDAAGWRSDARHSQRHR